ncbi:hypothetical protein BCON_0256g00100 [Botryotinia convoluta]|uniref:Uncharacterized protein n=1 Tax=Botryotinia convoluta TaxID=54673 RepID=A0A4Z1HL37_9HELO|nr:hypothetical protein BCON_0256g00100 [Botryotinia convoluta]
MYLTSEESLTVQSHEAHFETTKFFVSKFGSETFLTYSGLYLNYFEATNDQRRLNGSSIAGGMGNESLIISVIIIVVTAIGCATGFFVWYQLRRSRQYNGEIQMNPLQERRPDGRRGRVHEEDRRTQNRHQGNLGLADIIGNSLDRPRDRTESNDGRSLADIAIPPSKQLEKVTSARLKKAKKRDITEEPQDRPSTANAANRSSDRVRIFTAHDDQPTVGVGVKGKGKGKPAPGKFQRPVISPDNIDTPLITVESSTSCSQEEGSIKSES